MQKSEQINELAAALLKAQSEIRAAVKDAENPFFKSKYADLPTVWAACKEALQKNGLAVSQVTELADAGMILETILMHQSGQWIAGRYPVRPVKTDPQSLGSAMTYARRYSLASIVGVYTADEDDDGEQAMGRSQPPARSRAPEQRPSEGEERAAAAADRTSQPPPAPTGEKKGYIKLQGCISEPQAKRLFAIAGKARWPFDELKQYIEQQTGKKHTNEIPWNAYEPICTFVEKNPYPENQN